MEYKNYLGEWKNCNKHSYGVKAFEFFEADNELQVKVKGVGTGVVAGDWGKISCKPYAANIDSKIPIAFQANFSNDTFDAYLQFNVNKSLIILAVLIDFKKEVDKSGVFIREFFSLA